MTLGGSTSTGSIGSFAGATFTVPASIAGSKAVVFSDSATPTPNSAQAAFTVASSISLNPTSATTGTTVTVTGTGFRASVTVTIKYDGATQTTNPSTITTGTTGSFSATFAVPVSASGGHVVTATDGTNSPTATFTVNVGVLDHFAVTASGGGNIGTQTAGTAFQIRVTAQDAYGNTVTSYSGNPTLTYSAGTISPTSLGAFVNGVGSGSVTVTKAGSGVSITATDGTKSGTSNGFGVNSGVLASFAFNTISSSQTAGTAFSITITAQDVYGNTVARYVSSNSLTVSSGSISPTSTAVSSSGQWTGSVTLITSGSGITLGTTGGSPVKSGTSNSITVNPGSGLFGNNNLPGSSSTSIKNTIRGSLFTSPSYSVTAQSITAYVLVSSNHLVKAAIYTSTGTLVGSTQEVTVTTSNNGWVTFSFASGSKPTLTAGTSYILVVWANNVSGTANLYSSSGRGSSRSNSRTYGTWPSSVSFTTGSINSSIYCNYSLP